MPVNIIALALMPVSQVVAWLLVLKKELFDSVWKISTFYCLWAVYNRVFVAPQELGYISMGFLAVAAYFRNKHASLAGTGLVIANFLIPAMIIFGSSAAELAKLVKDTDSELGILWAYVFKLYFVSNLLLWSWVFCKFWKYRPGTYYRTVSA